MAMTTLRELWQAELQDLYGAEQQIVQALPNMMSMAKSAELKNALEQHLAQTRVQIERLELIFKELGQTTSAAGTGPRAVSGIESVIRHGEAFIPRDAPADVSDAALIAAAQHVEHYEMAGYGCARTHAQRLNEDHAAELLQQTLDEEGEADHKLSSLASGINQSAGDAARNDPDSRAYQRLRYIDLDDFESTGLDYADLTVRNREGEGLGSIDGFIVDDTGRPYYVVVDSGGWFVGRRYVVPVGKLTLNREQEAVVIDLPKEVFTRYPEFRSEAFLAMSDQEAKRYEWRVIEAIDPQGVREAGRRWDYEELPYYLQPDWLDSEAWAGTPTGSSRSAETERPIGEHPPDRGARQERERVKARDLETTREPASVGGSDRRSSERRSK